MSDEYRYYVEEYWYDCDACRVDLSLARADYNGISAMAFVGAQKFAIYAIRGAFDGLIDAVYHLISHQEGSPFNYNCYMALKEADEYTDGGNGGITWQAICEAWVANDFEGKEWTIACIDQMRKLMWDEPFSIQWASNPTSQR